MRLQFRLESFNAFNHTQFQAVSTNLTPQQLRRRDVGATGPHQPAGVEAALLSGRDVGWAAVRSCAPAAPDVPRMSIALPSQASGWRALAVTGARVPGRPRRSRAQQPDPAVLQQHARKASGRWRTGATPTRRRRTRRCGDSRPAAAEVHARLGLIYFQQGKFADAVPPLREALRLKPGPAERGRAAGHVAVRAGPVQGGAAGLRRRSRSPADPVLRRMAGLHLQRTYTGLGRDRDAVDVALRLSRLYPDDPEVLYHSGRLFANFAYLQTMKLADGRAGLRVAAPGGGRSEREPGTLRRGDPRVPAGARDSRRAARASISASVASCSNASKRDGSAADEPEARRAFEAELALDPTNANAAYELAEMQRKAGELEPARELFEQAVAHHPAFEQARSGSRER